MTFTKMASMKSQNVLGEAMNAYVDWREECIAVSDAYASWTAAEATDAALAFAGYVAALDREEVASQLYAFTIQRAGDLVTTDGAPLLALGAPGAGRHGR